MSAGVTIAHSAFGEVIQFSLQGRTALNLIGSETLRIGAAQIREQAGDQVLRCAVLTGAHPGSFIGGADLKELGSLDEDTAEAFIRSIHEFCSALRDFPVPVIARVAGHCLGGGLEIAAACDFRLAASSSQFGMPEVRVGVPSVIEAALLPRLIGWGRTRELVFRGHLIDAATAERIGLVEQVTSPAALDALLAMAVDDIRAGAPAAIRAQKRLVRRWEQLSIDSAIEAGVGEFVQAYRTGEPAAYTQAFFARGRRNAP